VMRNKRDLFTKKRMGAACCAAKAKSELGVNAKPQAIRGD